MTNQEIKNRLKNPSVIFQIQYAMKNEDISFGEVNECKLYSYFITDLINEVECFEYDVLQFGIENVRKFIKK